MTNFQTSLTLMCKCAIAWVALHDGAGVRERDAAGRWWSKEEKKMAFRLFFVKRNEVPERDTRNFYVYMFEDGWWVRVAMAWGCAKLLVQQIKKVSSSFRFFPLVQTNENNMNHVSWRMLNDKEEKKCASSNNVFLWIENQMNMRQMQIQIQMRFK